MSFPATRLRRLRRTDTLRALVRETSLSLDDVVMPLFACPGEGVVRPVAGLPGIAQRSVDEIVREAHELTAAGVRAVLLFGIPESKDADGSGAWDDDGIVQRALRALRAEAPGLTLLTDVCLCEYTEHGHCGTLDGDTVANDETLESLVRTAVSHVEAGADAVCPSDMMDGRVGAIRVGAARGRRSSRTRRSTHRRSTGRSARSRSRRRRSATAAATRWIPRTHARRCGSARSTSRRARTS